MKVLIISDNYLDFIKSQAEAISKEIDEVFVLVISPKIPQFLKKGRYAQYKKEKLLDLQNKPKNVHVIHTTYLETNIRNIFFVKNAIKKAIEIIKKEKIDIIHAHFILKNGYVGQLIKSKTKKPLVVTVHENHDWYKMILTNPNKKVRLVLQSADKLIRVNDIDTKLLIKKSKKDKVVAIPNGFSFNNFKKFKLKKIIKLKKELNIDPKKITILSVGLLNKRKNHVAIINALKIIKEKEKYQLIIIGEGPDYDKIKEESKRNHIQTRIIRFVPFNDMIKWYNVADIFCIMSTSESFGLVYLEALACETPIIAFKNVGSEYVLEKGKLGLYAKNYKELAKIIEDKKYFIPKNVKQSIKQFSWTKVAKDIVNEYKKIK